MRWSDRLKQEVPKQDIPRFLADLQALVQALRDGRAWQHRWTPALAAHRDLAIAYLDEGPKKDAVIAFTAET